MKWVLRKMLQTGFYFFDEGKIIEEGTPDHFFKKPKEKEQSYF